MTGAAPKIDLERRGAALEVRAKGRRLQGLAAVFDMPTKIGEFSEIVRRGAFAASLASGADILALADHDPRQVLARTRSGTLRLAEDSRGLAFDFDVPPTSIGNDLIALAERGDLGGASFGFRVTAEKWNGSTRELVSVDLREISIVQAFPAYAATTVAVRSRPDADRLRRLGRYLDVIGG